MTDHPFDEIAVNFALEAVKAIIDRQANTLEDITDLIVPAALTAACKSMKERGKAIDVQYQDDAHPFRPQSNSPVTIFRHGE